MKVLKYDPYKYSKEFLLNVYRHILFPRLIEEKMLLLLRQGKVSKWFSGIGQEAISVGSTLALLEDEYIFTLHRNLGVFTSRNVPLDKLFAQLQGKFEGYTKGRDRSFHFGAKENYIVGMISHLGPQLSLAAGVALAHKLKRQERVTLAFSGDGGTSQGEFHEALNLASVWKLPVIFLIENNQYGLSTPISEQYACESLSDRGVGYGIEAITIDGNNVLEVYETINSLATQMRADPRPVMVECNTFRLRGHEESSGIDYVPAETLNLWKARDPILFLEEILTERNILDPQQKEQIYSELKEIISQAVDVAFNLPEPVANTAEEIKDVYCPYEALELLASSERTKKLRYVDAVSEGLMLSLEKNDNLVLMGQDIAGYGGVFKVTEGFLDKFGPQRIRNTPLCESAVIGAALGMSIGGFKTVVEMQFSDFVTCGFNQIVNNLAKLHYRWGEKADVVIRMPCGGSVGAGPFHSQTNEAWFFHVPGLKIVYPAFPEDAKGLLLSAIEDPNPVLYFEHKRLYRSIEADVPEDFYLTPIGQAKCLRFGEDVTIVTYGLGVHWALEILDRNPDISADLIDLRSILPLDFETIKESVQNTGRVIILHEANLIGGVGAEIAAFVAKECFSYLEAPVERCASLDTPIPFATALENNYIAKDRFEQQLINLLLY